MTHAQKKAASPAYSVWVAASAGTGKTKILVDRVLRLLLEGTLPDKILCITFTKAAAAEMTNRIYSALAQWVEMEESALSEALAVLIDTAPTPGLLHRARVLFATVLDAPEGLRMLTIHSFCQSVLQRFPLEAKVPPHFKIVDDNTARELLDEAQVRFFSTVEKDSQERAPLKTRFQDSLEVGFLEIPEKGFMHAIEQIACYVPEGGLYDIIHKVLEKKHILRQAITTWSWEGLVEKIYHALGITVGANECEVLAEISNDTNFEKGPLLQTCNAMHKGGKRDKEAAPVLMAWLMADTHIRIAQWHSYEACFFTQDDEPRKTLIYKESLHHFPDGENILKQEQARLLQLKEKIKACRTATLTEALLLVGMAVLSVYEELKEAKAMLDYDDLIHHTLYLLENTDISSWVLYKLEGGTDHILVDEAQDTSPGQWRVIEMLCQETFAGQGGKESQQTIFIVGDEKQSIFSFQGADPAIFATMHQLFASRMQQAEKAWQSISLEHSFRSTAAVLQCVDTVFSEPLFREAISAQPGNISHGVYRMGQGGRVEVWPLQERQQKETQDTPGGWELPVTRKEEQTPAVQLAEEVALTISGWLTGKRILPSRGRPVGPGDVMILVRSRSALVDHLVKALKAHDIPMAGTDRMVLGEHLAVMDLKVLGEFLLLPQDDLALATVLKTPLIGLSEEALFTLAYARDKQTLWERLKEKASQNERYQQAYFYLSDLLAKVDYLRPYDLYGYILETKGGRKMFACRLGTQAFDPIDEFMTLALEYERVHIPTLQGFLHWLSVGKNVISRDMEQGKNELRIMTVHGAKGLQAPIVFLPDTTHAMESGAKKTPYLFWKETEEGIPLMFWAGQRANEPSLLQNLRKKEAEQERKESMRLLYVALTRAEDELYIAGCQNPQTVASFTWYHMVESALKQIGRKEGDRWVLTCPQE